MPIRFRCTHCGQLLSISRKKAGEEASCPQCAQRIRIPKLKSPQAKESLVAGGMTGLGRAPTPSASRPAANAPVRWGDEEEDDDDEFALRKAPADESGLDMTPMVDVVMLLLIFFMITASFATQKSLQTTAPEPDEEGFAAQALTVEDVVGDSVVVNIDEDGNLLVDETPVAGFTELREALSAKMSQENKREMLIEAHPLATHGTVVSVMDAGADVQMQRIRRSSRRGEQ